MSAPLSLADVRFLLGRAHLADYARRKRLRRRFPRVLFLSYEELDLLSCLGGFGLPRIAEILTLTGVPRGIAEAYLADAARRFGPFDALVELLTAALARMEAGFVPGDVPARRTA